MLLGHMALKYLKLDLSHKCTKIRKMKIRVSLKLNLGQKFIFPNSNSQKDDIYTSGVPSKIWASAKLPKHVWRSANLPK